MASREPARGLEFTSIIHHKLGAYTHSLKFIRRDLEQRSSHLAPATKEDPSTMTPMSKSSLKHELFRTACCARMRSSTCPTNQDPITHTPLQPGVIRSPHAVPLSATQPDRPSDESCQYSAARLRTGRSSKCASFRISLVRSARSTLRLPIALYDA
jgi:hypothetical protein